MYTKRYINPHFWDDPYVVDLNRDEKLLFLYCLSNPLVKISGFYEISLKRMAFDTGMNIEEVEKILQKFEADGKIAYYQSFIIIPNYPKQQKYNPNMLKNVLKDIEAFGSLLNPSKAFQTLRKNFEVFQSLPKVEVEVEVEAEAKASTPCPSPTSENKEAENGIEDVKDDGGSTPKPPSSKASFDDNGHKSLVSLSLHAKYDPKKDKGPAWGGKHEKRPPPAPIKKLFELYERVAAESYWQPLPDSQDELNALAGIVLKPMVRLWEKYPSLEWWEKYFRAVSDNRGIQEMVEKDKFVPSLPWLLEPHIVHRYVSGQYTGGKLPKDPVDAPKEPKKPKTKPPLKPEDNFPTGKSPPTA